jgi:phosphoribosylformylglycinamidine synthase
VEDLSQKTTLSFSQEGDSIYLIGQQRNDINCSSYLHKIKGVEFSPAPYFDLEEEFVLQENLKQLIEQKLIQSCHDISDGGLIITLLEKGFYRELGFDVQATDSKIRKDAFWFGEAASRVVITTLKENEKNLEDFLTSQKVVFVKLGKVTKSEVRVDEKNWGGITEWKELYNTAIERHLEKRLESEGALSML